MASRRGFPGECRPLVLCSLAVRSFRVRAAAERGRGECFVFVCRCMPPLLIYCLSVGGVCLAIARVGVGNRPQSARSGGHMPSPDRYFGCHFIFLKHVLDGACPFATGNGLYAECMKVLPSASMLARPGRILKYVHRSSSWIICSLICCAHNDVVFLLYRII